MKQLAKRIALHPGLISLADRVTNARVPVLMLHRFSRGAVVGEDEFAEGHHIEELRRNLEYLRRSRFVLLSLDALIDQLSEGRRDFRRTVVFTVDDGYEDFKRLAMPVFSEFDCPVTVFLSSGVLDRTCWFWWDRLDFALRSTRHEALNVPVGDSRQQYRWSAPTQRLEVLVQLTEALKRVPHAERLRLLDEVTTLLDVDVPDLPTPAYSAMTWDEVRACEATGLAQFGPHTVTHPILSTVNDTSALNELSHSWDRLRDECTAPVPIFAYPNGTADAYGTREVEILRTLGMKGAVTTESRYASELDFNDPAFPVARFAIPRLPYPDAHDDFLQAVHGVEHVKWILRGRPSHGHPGAWSAHPG